MPKSPELERLAEIGELKREPPVAGEVEGLLKSGEARLSDAGNTDLSLDGRFDLAYNAAHALAHAALRSQGYRSTNRYLVFQALEHTLGIPATTWRVLAKAHQQRNLAEYEGCSSADQRLVDDTISAAQAVLEALRKELSPS